MYSFTGLSVVRALNYHLKSEGSSLRPDIPLRRQAVIPELCNIRIITILEHQVPNGMAGHTKPNHYVTAQAHVMGIII